MSGRRLAIAHVAVAPMDEARLLHDQTVLVEGDHIRQIGPSSAVDVTGCEVLEGAGLYLAPGLADMHVHCWDTGEAGLFLANGVTLIRNMWGAPMHLAWQRKLRSGALLGPDLVTTSPIIDGPGEDGGTVWPGSPLLTEPDQAAAMVHAYADRGYQQIKAYSWLRLDTLAALGRAARDTGLRVTGHCPDGVTFEQAVDAGMSCFEHLTQVERGHLRGMEAPLPMRRRGGRLTDPGARSAFQHLDFDAIHRLGAFLAERQAWNCPTLVVSQGSTADLEEARSDPRLRYVWPTMRASWDPANDFRSRGRDRSSWLEPARARVAALVEVLRVLHQEGAPILLGTDTPNPWVLQGFSIHDELDNLVAAGMSPFEAIASGTSRAAAFLGEQAQWGTVSEGLRADMVLLRRNPLDGVGAYRDLEAVFVRGRHLTRNDLDALLEERARALTAEIPTPDLDHPAGPGEPVAGGRLQERVAGVTTSRLIYDHRRLPDGSWQLEEHANSAGYGSESRHASSFHLAPDLTLQAGRHRITTELGEERLDVIRAPEAGYRVSSTAIDGVRSEAEVGTGPLLPGERLAMTWPALLAGLVEPPAVPAIDAGGEGAGVVSFALSRPSPDLWQLRIERAGTVTDQRWRFQDGKVTGVEEMTWRGLRELTPEPGRSQEDD